MRIKYSSLKSRLFLILYAVAAFSKLQANLWTPYYDNDFVYIGYVAIITLWGIILMITQQKFKITKALKITLLAAGFIFVWGILWTNPTFKSLIYENAIKMLVMILFITLTSFLVDYYDCMKGFLTTSYFVQVGFLISNLFLHVEKKNWMYNIQTIFQSGVKDKLGYGTHANICGLVILITFSIGLLLKGFVNRQHRMIITAINGVLWVMLITTAARMAILCCLLLYIIIYTSRLFQNRQELWLKIVKSSFFVLVAFFVFASIYVEKFYNFFMLVNRYYAVSYYLDLYKASQRWLMGIGYVNFGQLPKVLTAYGFPITFAECTYVDIFVTTGIIGSIWLTTYFAMLIRYTMKSKYLNTPSLKIKMLAILVVVIIAGMAENVGFTDAYWISYAFLTLCMCMIRRTTT